jgi:hypothetical protein
VSELRIGVFQLAPKDVAYIRALVRLYAYSDKLSWSFAEQAPFDALVTREESRGDAGLAGFRGPLLSITTARPPLPADRLEYPIRADQFGGWLRDQQEVLGTAAATAGVAGAAMAAPVAAAAPRYRLRRWPSVQQLRGDPLRIRMATLMSRHPLSVAELARLTEQPLAACNDFITALHDASLLLAAAPAAVAAPAASPPAMPSPATPPVAAPATGTPGKAGLLASIRRRFGL